MTHELICTWLGLPPEEGWPPDHYRLLGLPPGEGNPELIEQRVHQRLDSVRCYQMMHPEQATETMNRLAQAFVCLTEPAAKKVYDAALFGRDGSAEAAAPASEAPNGQETAHGTAGGAGSTADRGQVVPAGASPAESPPELPAESPPGQPDPLAWLYNPASLAEEMVPRASRRGPPPRPIVPPPLPPDWPAVPPAPPQEHVPPVPAMPPAPAAPPAPVQPPAPPAPAAEPVDPVIEAARSSSQARRGLGTKRALYYRVARTRQLLRLWARVGKYLVSAKRPLAKQSEGKDLLDSLEEIQLLLEKFPPLMGEAGQPGYLVLALTQVDVVRTVRSLSVKQREALSRDWRAGQKLLAAHLDFLRQEIRALRQLTLPRRAVRAVRSFLNEQPGAALLLVVALLALSIALWRTYG